jgi:hypothetical protein
MQNYISFKKRFFGCIGVWTQGLTLARQALYHLSKSTSLLKCFIILFLCLCFTVSHGMGNMNMNKGDSSGVAFTCSDPQTLLAAGSVSAEYPAWLTYA